MPTFDDGADRAGHTTPPFIGLREKSGAASAGRAVTGRKAQEVVAQELLAELRLMRETNSQIAAHLRSGIVNDVLAVDLAQFDASGVITREYRTMIGSVSVVNHGTTDVTVSSAPQASSPGNIGKGLGRIPAGTSGVIHIGSHTVTLYGTPGAFVTLQVYTKPQPPVAGLTSNVVTVTTPLRPGTPLDVSATAAAGAAATATLAAAVGKTTWITGFEATWDSTGTGTVNDTITLTAGGTVLTYKVTTVAGAGGSLVVEFPSPIPATAQNTAVTVAVGATASRAGITLTAHGFQL